MDIQTRKIQFLQAFLKLQSEESVSLLERILKSETKDCFQSISMDELNERIDQSEDDFEEGNFKSREDDFEKYS
ncbi:MAG: hypothetical protein GDA42_11015 [Ekhidna sp.]|nr:hypothetical protein [Ekhidna sp.]MBC6410964.1 hypothetical protein [Ekhidna sp.]